MKDWMLLTIVFAIIMGVYYIFEKEAMRKNSYIEVLALSITMSFIILLFDIPNSMHIKPEYMLLIFVKSLVVFIGWLLSFKAMSRISVSKYGVINMSRILFTTFLGIVVLHEVLSLSEIIGMIIIVLGLLFVNMNVEKTPKRSKKYSNYLLLGCGFMSIAGLLDKVICTYVEPNVFQFWFLLFMFVINWIYILTRKIKINFQSTIKNPWIYLYSILYVIGDRIIFAANSIDGSEISIISLLKQFSVIITVIIGGKLFKEHNLRKKLLCSMIIFLGIIIVTLY